MHLTSKNKIQNLVDQTGEAWEVDLHLASKNKIQNLEVQIAREWGDLHLALKNKIQNLVLTARAWEDLALKNKLQNLEVDKETVRAWGFLEFRSRVHKVAEAVSV